jgi:hypothetical protein
MKANHQFLSNWLKRPTSSRLILCTVPTPTPIAAASPSIERHWLRAVWK